MTQMQWVSKEERVRMRTGKNCLH